MNGSNGRQSAKIERNTITVSVTGKNGTGVNTYEVSPDLTQCSHTVGCPAGFQAKVFSCSVEGNLPARAVTQQGPPAKTSPEVKTGPEVLKGWKSKQSRKPKQFRKPKQAQKGVGRGRNRRLSAPRQLLRNPTWWPQEPSRSKTRTTTACRLRHSYSCRAAAAFQAAGDTARSQAATDRKRKRWTASSNWQTNEGETRKTRIGAGFCAATPLQCYDRATRFTISLIVAAQSAEAGAFLGIASKPDPAARCNWRAARFQSLAKIMPGSVSQRPTAIRIVIRRTARACAPGKHLVSPPRCG